MIFSSCIDREIHKIYSVVAGYSALLQQQRHLLLFIITIIQDTNPHSTEPDQVREKICESECGQDRMSACALSSGGTGFSVILEYIVVVLLL